MDEKTLEYVKEQLKQLSQPILMERKYDEVKMEEASGHQKRNPDS